MSTHQIIPPFEQFQKARVLFVQSVAEDLAAQSQLSEALQSHGVVPLLHALVQDKVPSIQRNSLRALGRLASCSEQVATEIAGQNSLLPQVVSLLRDPYAKLFKQDAIFVFRSIARHSSKLAQTVMTNSQAVEAVIDCLNDLSLKPEVRAEAARTLGYMGRHEETTARRVVKKGAILPLLRCAELANEDGEVKRIAASALCDIAKLSPELAHAVGDGRCHGRLNVTAYNNAKTQSPKKKTSTTHSPQRTTRQEALSREGMNVFRSYQRARISFTQTIAQLSTNPEQVELLQMCGVLSLLRLVLPDNNPSIQVYATSALSHLTKSHPEFSAEVASSEKGVLPLLVCFLSNSGRGYKKVSTQCLGYIARHDADLAQSIVDQNAIPLLLRCVAEKDSSPSGGDHAVVKRNAVFALACISKNAPELAQAVVDQGAAEILVPLRTTKDPKLKQQVLQCLAQIGKHTSELGELVGEVIPSPPECTAVPTAGGPGLNEGEKKQGEVTPRKAGALDTLSVASPDQESTVGEVEERYRHIREFEREDERKFRRTDSSEQVKNASPRAEE